MISVWSNLVLYSSSKNNAHNNYISNNNTYDNDSTIDNDDYKNYIMHLLN